MNREIKFRAWDDTLKIMLEPIDLSQNPKYWEWSLDYERQLMQYTGLKDKNGKEIYEGDIILTGCCKHLVVCFHKGRFVASYNTDINPICGGVDETDMVIGNIYENPELLVNNTCNYE